MGKSRKRIIEASYQLFEKRNFEKITVEDILKEADVSRGTFYKYFDNKYDLMYLYYSDFLQTYIKSNYTGKNWYELQTKCYQFGFDHRDFFKNIKDVYGQESFWNFMHRVSFDIFKNIKCMNESRDNLTEEEEVTIHAFVGAAIYVFKEYAIGQTTLSAERLSEIIYKMIPDDYKIYELK